MLAGLTQRTTTTSIDYFCLKCSLILVEPVLLPCQHRFCLICLNESIRANILCCPHCSKRFGSWLRLKNASNVNVNTDRLHTTAIAAIDTASVAAATIHTTPSKIAATVNHSIINNNDLVDASLWSTIKERFNDLLLKRNETKVTRCQAVPIVTATINTNAKEFGGATTTNRECETTTSCTIMKPKTAQLTDSITINEEMTHFRPIRVMPISIIRS